MIPNTFICSTIENLQYLRDAVREAVEELAYHPVMSEHGEVGYLNRSTAAEVCYRSISQCQLAVVIVGKVYNEKAPNELSVTHEELRAARKNGMPVITFVENEVLVYKRVYDANVAGGSAQSFPGMNNPSKTFSLLDEIRSAPAFNGLIPFASAAEMKRILKLQIADLVGEKLVELTSPIKTDVQELLSEIKTLRHELKGGKGDQDRSYLRTVRFLLDDANTHYRHFIERLCGDVDIAVPHLIEASSFDDFLQRADAKIELVEDEASYRAILQSNWKNGGFASAAEWAVGIPLSANNKLPTAWYCIQDSKSAILNSRAKKVFEETHAKLRAALSRK